ncbi:hypothetical protein B0T25DRAFT_574478 [Lasiosphaeria hispida]|uniref:Late sexual development protein n=1 Tax=Lasiosphaeria hispida TaxID=260671 RepID=A0AAJ0M995_9PEZI|nr:hypothetical protein B0T25DRAFT_574478 [Lasiosphaeria hispida]
MRFTTAIASAAAFAGLAVAAPAVQPRAFSIPAGDGFPSPNPAQLAVINDLADGTLSNAPPPAKINEASFPVFQLIAFNENFEVAFFSSLIQNITNGVPGFDLPSSPKKDELLDILQTVLAQEKLHAINAINTLKKFNAFAPTPCQYQFPTSNIYEAISLAERFTDLVLGTLQDAAQILARNGDVGPVRGVTASLGQEGQQEGFYRILLSKKPSEKPFLTTNVAAFAFSALQQFIVPGSCPFPLDSIKLPIFPAVNVISGKGGVAVEPRDQTLSFQVDLTSVKTADKYVGGKGDGLFVTYFSGQLLPISVPVVNAKWAGRVVTFEANFPFSANFMYGLSVASLTTSGAFAAPGDVVAATLAAPGLIQVDDRVKSWDGFKL